MLELQVAGADVVGQGVAEDVIEGVSFQIQDTGSTSITVTQTSEDITEQLNGFVDAYNDLVSKVEEVAGFNSDTESGGVLQGDYTVTNAIRRVRGVLTGQIEGFTADGDAFANLADIGMELDRDGKMSLDTAKLEEALAEDYEAVTRLVSADNSAVVSDYLFQYLGSSSQTDEGQYRVAVDYDGAGNMIDARMRKIGSANSWQAASFDPATGVVTGSPATDSEGLKVMSVFGGGAGGTQYSYVTLRDGFTRQVDETLDDMLDPLDGVFKSSQDNIQKQIDSLDRRIEEKEDRLETKEQYLRERYARMEAELARLDEMKGSVQSMMSSMMTAQSG